MADFADLAADAEQAHRDRALAAIPKGNATGASECDCGNEITPVRQRLGATRCLPCQQSFELRARQRRG